LTLSVWYAQDRSVKQFEIRRYSTALNEEPHSAAQLIDAGAAEQVLDEVLTPAFRKALVPSIEAISGRLGQASSVYGRLTVTRNFWAGAPEGRILGYTVSWR